MFGGTGNEKVDHFNGRLWELIFPCLWVVHFLPLHQILLHADKNDFAFQYFFVFEEPFLLLYQILLKMIFLSVFCFSLFWGIIPSFSPDAAARWEKQFCFWEVRDPLTLALRCPTYKAARSPWASSPAAGRSWRRAGWTPPSSWGSAGPASSPPAGSSGSSAPSPPRAQTSSGRFPAERKDMSPNMFSCDSPRWTAWPASCTQVSWQAASKRKEKNFHSPNLDIRSLEGNISHLGLEGVDKLPEMGEQGAHPEDPAGSIGKVPDVNGQWCALSHQDSKQLFWVEWKLKNLLNLKEQNWTAFGTGSSPCHHLKNFVILFTSFTG